MIDQENQKQIQKVIEFDERMKKLKVVESNVHQTLETLQHKNDKLQTIMQ